LSTVDEVFWIEGKPAAGLGIVLCPFGGPGLEDEMRSLKEAGVETLVSLLQKPEAEWLGLGAEEALATKVGMEFLSHPIRDANVPTDAAAFREFAAGLAERLRAGKRIALHCRGSIGRAPLTAACTLVHFGWKAKTALRAIEVARGCRVPDTDEQWKWILGYKAKA
jgi:protein-tyrosine phosphatase